jgi:hypothetical protein
MQRGNMEQSDLTYIKIPYPKEKDLHFKITAPINSLDISPGIGNAWATGKYNDPKFVMPLSVKQSKNIVEITAVGAFAYRTPPKLLPHMTLSFGRTKPFSLSILAGDLSDHLNFGGLPLSSLDIQYGESHQFIDFSYPNPQVMRQMEVTAGRSPIQIENFANANAAEIRLNGDSTSYRLNFGCELKRSTILHIGMAVSRVQVFLPSGTAIKITSVNPPISSQIDDFSYVDKAFWNSPARDHQEPLLYIHNVATNSSSLHIQYI